MFQKGRKYLCVNAKSNAYTVGCEYECFLGDNGKLCLRGDDGLVDQVSNLVSKFKEVKNDAAR